MNNNEVGNSPGDDHDTMIRQKFVFASPLLIAALIISAATGTWGLVDIAGFDAGPAFQVHMASSNCTWLIMTAVSFMLIVSIWLEYSRYGGIKLVQYDNQPECSTASWLTMLFAAGDLNPGIYHLVWNTN